LLAPYINESTAGAASKPHPEDVLVAEATETLELAEEQVEWLSGLPMQNLFYFLN